MVSIISLLGMILLLQPAETKRLDYYSGDSIYYKNNLYITSSNSGALEVFKLENNNLTELASVKAVNERFNTNEDFNDSTFKVINQSLYVYGVSKYSLYRYKVNENDLSFNHKIKNNNWEWYDRVDVFNDYLVTISSKGVKEWNNNMQVIKNYDLSSDHSYNIDSAGSKYYIFNQEGSKLKIYNKNTRDYINDITLNYKSDSNRQVYFNEINSKIFAVDDFYLKKFSINGELENSFRHLDYTGYDVKSSNNEFIYFSNGLGVVKLRADDLSLVNSRVTTYIGEPDGWAMGLNVVATNNGDRIVLYNNSNILILDENLRKIDHVKASHNNEPEIAENLFLNLDKNSAASNSEIQVSGGGFGANEELKIEFLKEKHYANANNLGRFETIITVPEVRKSQRADIKVIGKETGLHYSISFNIE